MTFGDVPDAEDAERQLPPDPTQFLDAPGRVQRPTPGRKETMRNTIMGTIQARKRRIVEHLPATDLS